MKFADEGKPQPAGTQFLGLMESLIDLFKEPGISNVEVVFVSYKLDDKGEKIVHEGMHVAEIHAVGITGISSEIQEDLRKRSDTDSLISQMILYRDAAKPQKLGILKFQSLGPGRTKEYEDWEKKAIANYFERNGL